MTSHLVRTWLLRTLLAMPMALLLAACSDDDSSTPAPAEDPSAQQIRNFYAPGDGRDASGTSVNIDNNTYQLINLTSGDTTLTKANASGNNWDIGFRSLDIIVNGGPRAISRTAIEPARTGNALYAVLTNTTWEQVTSVPAQSSFRADSTSRLANTAPSGGSRPLMATSGSFTTGVTTVRPVPGTILIVKLASSNRYAKIEFQSYYQGYPDAAGNNAPADPVANGRTPYWTFRYELTAEGGTSF